MKRGIVEECRSDGIGVKCIGITRRVELVQCPLDADGSIGRVSGEYLDEVRAKLLVQIFEIQVRLSVVRGVFAPIPQRLIGMGKIVLHPIVAPHPRHLLREHAEALVEPAFFVRVNVFLDHVLELVRENLLVIRARNPR